MTDIGFDPTLWVERLIEVNASSSFTNEERIFIDAKLKLLLKELKQRKK